MARTFLSYRSIVHERAVCRDATDLASLIAIQNHSAIFTPSSFIMDIGTQDTDHSHLCRHLVSSLSRSLLAKETRQSRSFVAVYGCDPHRCRIHSCSEHGRLCHTVLSQPVGCQGQQKAGLYV